MPACRRAEIPSHWQLLKKKIKTEGIFLAVPSGFRIASSFGNLLIKLFSTALNVLSLALKHTHTHTLTNYLSFEPKYGSQFVQKAMRSKHEEPPSWEFFKRGSILQW